MKHYIDEATGAVYAYEDAADAEVEENGTPKWRLPGLTPCPSKPDQYHTWDTATKTWTLTEVAQKTADQLGVLTSAVQSHLDTTAQAHGYDNMNSAVTYADEPTVLKFQQEGKALRAWRSLTWAACYNLMGEVKSGMRPQPTVDELIALLPAITGMPA